MDNDQKIIKIINSKFSRDDILKEEWIEYVKEWNLTHFEDELFSYFLTVDKELNKEKLSSYDEILRKIRNNHEGSYNLEKLKQQKFTNVVLEDLDIQFNFLVTLHKVLNNNETATAILLIDKLEPFVFPDGKEFELRDDSLAFYRIIFVVLLTSFFPVFPEIKQLYLFMTSLLVFSFNINLDFEKLIRETLDWRGFYGSRKNLCLDFAAAITKNDSVLGKKSSGDKALVKDWITMFRVYSEKTLNPTRLINFLNDENYVSSLNGKEKNLVREIIQLYTKLVNGYFMIPGGDFEKLEEIEKEIENKKKNKANKKVKKNDDNKLKDETQSVSLSGIKQEIISRFGSVKEDNISEIFTYLEKRANDFNAPEIKDLVYFDEDKGEFKWNEEVLR